MEKWLVVLVVFFLASTCSAQAASTTKETRALVGTGKVKNKEQPVAVIQKQAKAPTAKFSMGMIEGERIERGYVNLPKIGEVVNAIEKLSGQSKGEFESTADFNARKAVALATKFLGDSRVEDTFAFVVPVKKSYGFSSGGLEYGFNADSSELSLFVLALSSEMNGIGAPNYPTSMQQSNGLDKFDLDSKVSSKNTYQASNAYGATVTVEKTVATKLGIAANRIPFLNYERESYYDSNPKPAVQLNMENAKAARELPVLKALIVMNLADPYIVYNFSHLSATRDDPTEFMDQGKYLAGNVLGIVFFSGLTGEVFARIPDSFGKPEPKTTQQREAKPADK